MEKIKLKELKQVIEDNLMETVMLGKNLILDEPNDSDVEKIYDNIKLKVIKNIIYDTNTNIVYKGKYEEYYIDPQDIENIKFVKKEILPILNKEKEKLLKEWHNELSENDCYLYKHSIDLDISNSHNILNDCAKKIEFLTERKRDIQDLLEN